MNSGRFPQANSIACPAMQTVVSVHPRGAPVSRVDVPSRRDVLTRAHDPMTPVSEHRATSSTPSTPY